MTETRELPMLPMRDIVIFPQMTTPFFIGRKQSMEALEEALKLDREVFVVAQRDPMLENPSEDDLYRVGAIGVILQIMRLPNGTIKALFEARSRGRMVSADTHGSSFRAQVETIEESNQVDAEFTALAKVALSELENYLRDIKRNTENMDQLSLDVRYPHLMADKIVPLLNLDLQKKQELLEIFDSKKRLQQIFKRMLEETEIKKLGKRLKERVQGQIGRTQKEYYLNEQIKAIQRELGNGEDGKAELEGYEKKLKEKSLSKEAQDVAEKETKKLKMMSPMSAEANVVRNYLDTLLGMPWGIKTKDNLDLNHAEKVLNEDHHGLERVKERIIEYLAVAKRVACMRGPIICLVGPPGVGKTSLAKSVARALGRKFTRMSLGGIRDEAEIRGHRRTYIGALPGKVVQAIRKAGSNNPLMLLDEVDKMTNGVMGDPAAALLEVLDQEQNNTFMDHYLEVEYDLSDVLFFCTANDASGIPAALIDRMEVISLSGYTEIEKERIALKHLMNKQRQENGLTSANIQFGREAVLEIIRHYTREAGVRGLEREISKVMRKVATKIVITPATKKLHITVPKIQELLGPYIYKYDYINEQNQVGVANGMAWTQAGGDLLFVETALMPGDNQLICTGSLGSVMKESVQAAISYVRANANKLGIYSSTFKNKDAHIHFPEGAIPKDGPSAGVTLVTSIVSAFTNIPVRKEVAMTGEVTLHGKVLQIGGLKEKLMAAKRGGVTQALIPIANEKDIAELPKEIRQGIKINPLHHVMEYLELALERMPEPVLDPDPISTSGETILPSKPLETPPPVYT